MPNQPRPLAHGLKRGAKGRCPNCGEGRLFKGYLKVEPECSACGHANGAYRADDGPAYFTILLIGHLFIAPLVLLPVLRSWSPAVLCAVLLPALALITLGLLRVTKGSFIGVLWSTRAGSSQ
jgi:uncharacterized protein (DUF983 family)